MPGVGLVHAPVSLLPMPFPESHWKQACEVAPIFNELVDRVSLDSEFLQESLSRLKVLPSTYQFTCFMHSRSYSLPILTNVYFNNNVGQLMV